MLFTLYYMYATLIQWWRISSMRNKISKAMNNQTALVLYAKEKRDLEKHHANMKDLLFFTDNKVGCTMLPKRRVFLNSWMPFSSSTLFPSLSNSLKLLSPGFPILIHADLETFNTNQSSDKIHITDLGIPVAWIAEDEFSIVLKTDLDNFAKLISCFLSNTLIINDGMEVLQIETIDIDGEPKVVENETVFKKVKWPFPVSSHNEWNKFVDDLKFICKKTGEYTNSKNGNITHIKDSHSQSQIPIIVSEVVNENSIQSSSSSSKQIELNSEITKHKPVTPVELKPDKKVHKDKKHTDKVNSSVVEKSDKEKSEKEKCKEGGNKDKDKDKDKRSTTKEKEKQLKHSTSTEKIKHKNKEKDTTTTSNSKGKRIVKKHSKENIIEPVKVPPKMSDKPVIKKPYVKTKPPNVLVYADSLETRENVKIVLNQVLNKNRYTIYELPSSGAPHFTDNSTLVVVCGAVHPNLISHLLNYLLNGGNLLCLCSDFLNSVLHTFTTAEVREHELVRFSYGQWKSVQMMHHIFCYQASPAKKHFSQDSDPNSSNHSSGNSPVAPRTPSTVDLHHNNRNYTIQFRVLGQEETWQTPSILLADVKGAKGKAVFSQVHLEIDPTHYQSDESKFSALKESNSARLEILRDILSSHLEMDCSESGKDSDLYTAAFFLGKHDSKSKLLSEVPKLVDNKLQLTKLQLQFCGKGVDAPQASSSLLPILIHSCPEHFSTIEYFENLQTKCFGRLVIYSDVMTSSMDVLDNVKYEHGLAVLPARQTQGKGRGGNAWLSPIGCAMFSLQLHIPMDSVLAKALPIIQHLVSVAIVSGIRSQPGYEDIDLGLKWPNDIYAESSVKIGGLILNSCVESSVAVCNVGSGTNLNNALPTTCINKLITKHNEAKGTNLKTFSYEKYLAIVFTELERIYDIVQNGNIEYLYDLYYRYWLHSGAAITVQTKDGSTRDVTVTGIDQYGFLVVTSKDGVTSSVEPDGNTFDMMQGLIAPKIH